MEGKTICFYRCPDLVNTLLDSRRQGGFGKLMANLEKLDLLIIHELGFIPQAPGRGGTIVHSSGQGL
ncbi:ATP-binding protein [Neomoorella humiferrea]|uniref:ATP-binding protein n=1 Tax=Neomoorella humiferrea TaxID=676965 RepID=UPI003BAF7E79